MRDAGADGQRHYGQAQGEHCELTGETAQCAHSRCWPQLRNSGSAVHCVQADACSQTAAGSNRIGAACKVCSARAAARGSAQPFDTRCQYHQRATARKVGVCTAKAAASGCVGYIAGLIAQHGRGSAP